ncbi:hypothetical protein C8J57DRAFT_1246361 [Mycena rebaudengoi]|nr:hypothetical protein C8J57DRAFT_1246361 [Mycena rebaudengoi]
MRRVVGPASSGGDENDKIRRRGKKGATESCMSLDARHRHDLLEPSAFRILTFKCLRVKAETGRGSGSWRLLGRCSCEKAELEMGIIGTNNLRINRHQTLRRIHSPGNRDKLERSSQRGTDTPIGDWNSDAACIKLRMSKKLRTVDQTWCIAWTMEHLVSENEGAQEKRRGKVRMDEERRGGQNGEAVAGIGWGHWAEGLQGCQKDEAGRWGDAARKYGREREDRGVGDWQSCGSWGRRLQPSLRSCVEVTKWVGKKKEREAPYSATQRSPAGLPDDAGDDDQTRRRRRRDGGDTQFCARLANWGGSGGGQHLLAG